jgi:hypothetical protein
MCLGCKTCSAMMSPGDKYSVKVTDEQMNGYKETFMMFDKVRIALFKQEQGYSSYNNTIGFSIPH